MVDRVDVVDGVDRVDAVDGVDTVDGVDGADPLDALDGLHGVPLKMMKGNRVVLRTMAQALENEFHRASGGLTDEEYIQMLYWLWRGVDRLAAQIQIAEGGVR